MGEVGLKLCSVAFVVWFCMLRGAFWGQSGSCICFYTFTTLN